MTPPLPAENGSVEPPRSGDERPRCQHCPCLADERSFMCEDCASEADAERDRMAEALRAIVLAPIGAVDEKWRATARIGLGEGGD